MMMSAVPRPTSVPTSSPVNGSCAFPAVEEVASVNGSADVGAGVEGSVAAAATVPGRVVVVDVLVEVDVLVDVLVEVEVLVDVLVEVEVEVLVGGDVVGVVAGRGGVDWRPRLLPGPLLPGRAATPFPGGVRARRADRFSLGVSPPASR